MKCKFENRIGAYLDKELTEDIFNQVKEHLMSCHICQKKLRELNDLKRFFECYSDEEVPENLNQKILSKLNPHVSKLKRNIINFAAAATIAFAFFSGLIMSNQTFSQNQDNSELISLGTESLYNYLEWEE